MSQHGVHLHTCMSPLSRHGVRMITGKPRRPAQGMLVHASPALCTVLRDDLHKQRGEQALWQAAHTLRSCWGLSANPRTRAGSHETRWLTQAVRKKA